MNIKHIFFDLDHTLWDFEANSKKAFETIFIKNKVEVDFNDFITTYSPINHKYWKLYRDNKVSKEDLRYGRLMDAFSELDYSVTDNLIHTLAKEYIDYLPNHNLLFDGAIDILNYLKPNYKLHMITNGFEEVQYKKMKNANLLPFFDQIITSEEVGVKKPNSKIFHYALEKSDAIPEESMMIGDNFEADILGAKNVGMHTIFCEFNGEIATEKVITVSKLSQIKNYL